MLTKEEIKTICDELEANVRQEQLKENVRKLAKELYSYVESINVKEPSPEYNPTKRKKKWNK